MTNIMNITLAAVSSFLMATALPIAVYKYWQDSQIKKKLKSSESSLENTKTSIEKNHVQAIEAFDGFNKELEEREEQKNDADHKSKRSKSPGIINQELINSENQSKGENDKKLKRIKSKNIKKQNENSEKLIEDYDSHTSQYSDEDESKKQDQHNTDTNLDKRTTNSKLNTQADGRAAPKDETARLFAPSGSGNESRELDDQKTEEEDTDQTLDFIEEEEEADLFF